MRQKRENTMLLKTSPKEVLDDLVMKLRKDTGLAETTIRDLFDKGWEWHKDRWVKHRAVPERALF